MPVAIPLQAYVAFVARCTEVLFAPGVPEYEPPDIRGRCPPLVPMFVFFEKIMYLFIEGFPAAGDPPPG